MRIYALVKHFPCLFIEFVYWTFFPIIIHGSDPIGGVKVVGWNHLTTHHSLEVIWYFIHYHHYQLYHFYSQNKSAAFAQIFRSKFSLHKPPSIAALIANSNPTNEKIKNYNSQNALSKIIHTHKADSLYVKNSNFLSDVENISQKQTSGLEKVSNEIIAGVQPI